MLSKSGKFSAVAAMAAAISFSSACGGDDTAAAMKCPEGTVAGTELECSCGDAGGMGKQVCQVDMTLTACNCDPGGSAGTSAAGTGAGTSAAGTTAGSGTGTSGTGATNDD